MIEERVEVLHALLSEVLTVQEAEWRRIACELQGETAQDLASLLVGLRAVEESRNLGQVKGAASTLRGLVSAALNDVERMARALGPKPASS
jgi:signal transduction histidine kinase